MIIQLSVLTGLLSLEGYFERYPVCIPHLHAEYAPITWILGQKCCFVTRRIPGLRGVRKGDVGNVGRIRKDVHAVALQHMVYSDQHRV